MPVNKKKEITLAASAARTATGNGTLEVDAHEYKQGAFYLDITAAGGTSPTLDVKVQTKDPVSGAWFDLVSFTQANAASKERKTVTGLLGNKLRVTWTIGGTSPTFTFSVGGHLEQE